MHLQTIYMYIYIYIERENVLALNSPQELICHKHNQPTNQIHYFFSSYWNHHSNCQLRLYLFNGHWQGFQTMFAGWFVWLCQLLLSYLLQKSFFLTSNHMASSNYSFWIIIIICKNLLLQVIILDTNNLLIVIWLKIFPSNTNILQTIIWFQVAIEKQKSSQKLMLISLRL